MSIRGLAKKYLGGSLGYTYRVYQTRYRQEACERHRETGGLVLYNTAPPFLILPACLRLDVAEKLCQRYVQRLAYPVDLFNCGVGSAVLDAV